MLGPLNKLKNRLGKGTWLQSALLSAVFLAVAILIWPHPAYADILGIGGAITNFFASLMLTIANVIGTLTLELIGLLVKIAGFNDFINAPAVVLGWKIVRDVANMFFIVILLLIAFGSVFRIEEYQYKKVLGKLLIMAVLVNFSKSITGFFIDIAQVVMLTFVNGFQQAAAGNFVKGFHIAEMFQFAESGTQPDSFTDAQYFAAAALALVSIIITAIVIMVYIIVFLLRIIALWFLTIISPLAYLLSAFPGDAKKYSSQWWDYFGKYATTGPILAFFLWLSLAVMQTTSNALGNFSAGSSDYTLDIPAGTITDFGAPDVLLSFIINIILLMGGLWMTQQLGVAGGKLAGSAFNKIQGAGAAIAKSPLGALKFAAKSANQSLVKATKGRVSLDVRDYAKAFKVAREDRRREAYQKFYGRKTQFFKEWGTPTGAAKLVLGAPSRAFGKAKQNRLAKAVKEGEDKLKQENKDEVYKKELLNENKEASSRIEKRKKRMDNFRGTEDQWKKLNDEQEADESLLKKNKDLLDLKPSELSKKYDEKVIKEIDDNKAKLTEIQSKDVLAGKTYEDKKTRAETVVKLEQAAINDMLSDNSKQQDKKRNDINNLEAKLSSATDEGEKSTLSREIANLEDDIKKLASQSRILGIKNGQLQSEAKSVEKGDAKTINAIALRSYTGDVFKHKQSELDSKDEEKSKEIAKIDSGIAVAESSINSDISKEEKDVINKELQALKEKKALLEQEQAEINSQKKKLDELSQANSAYMNYQGALAHRDMLKDQLAEAEKNKNVPGNEYKIDDLKRRIASSERTVKTTRDVFREKGTTPYDSVEEVNKINNSWQQQEASLKSEIAGKQKVVDTSDISNIERQQIGDQVKQAKEQLSKIRTAWYQTSEPADYYVERERRTNVSEEAKKITSENSDELIPQFEKAVASGNEALAMAVATKLTHDANLNELLNHYSYESNFKGLNQFRKEVLQNKLGLDEQSALQYQNDLSFGAERVNHWDSARTVGYDVNARRFYELSEQEHVQAALAEMLKIDNQVSARNFNRLAYGGETVGADGSRQFKMSELGKTFLLTAQNGLSSVMERFNINAAKNLSDPRNVALLEELVQQGKFQGEILRQIKERGSTVPGKPKEKK